MAAPATAHQAPAQEAHDPLDDMHAPAEQELCFQVRDAFSLALKSKRTPDQVFAMCGLAADDLRRFAQLQPLAAELLHLYLISKKAALGAAFFLVDWLNAAAFLPPQARPYKLPVRPPSTGRLVPLM